MTQPVFVHAADLHLGAPLNQLGKNLSPEIRKNLLHLAPKAFINLIDLTINRDAEFLVLAGDVYDRANREPAAQFAFRTQMERLNERNIKVYIVHGNHDPTSNDLSEYVKLPPNVKVYGPNFEEVVTHVLRDGSKVLVAGISYWRKDVTENLVPRLSEIVNKVARDDARAVIGILHTNIDSPEHEKYAPCSATDLQNSPFDYWALGHVHKRSVNRIGSSRYWAYPGNLQGRFFKEEGSKGALVVPIQQAGVGMPEHVACDVFRFLHLQIDCTKFSGEDISREVSQHCKEQIPESDGRPIVVRLRLFGTSTIVDEKLNEIGQADLTVDLSNDLSSYLHGGGIDRIEIDVEPEIDIKALKDADTIISDVINALEQDDLIALMNEQLKVINSKIILSPERLEEIRIKMQKNMIKDLYSKSSAPKS